MKPKRWVDLSAIKRLLVMPSCVCWFSCEAAAAAQQHSLIPLASAAHPWTVEPHLFSAKALWCPHLLYLFLSACCIRLQEPCRQHPRGWEGSFPWNVHTLIKMPLAVGHGPGFEGWNSSWHCSSGGCGLRSGWGASGGRFVFSGFSLSPSHFLSQLLDDDDDECFSPPSHFWWWIKSLHFPPTLSSIQCSELN